MEELNVTLDDNNSSNNNSSSSSCNNDVVSMFLQRYYVLLLIVFGIVGNALSGCVFMLSKLRSRTSSIYLTALSISDSCFLLALLYFSLATTSCLIIVYANSVFTSLSTWIIVCFTVERFIAVQYPLHRPLICTLRRSKLLLALVTLAAFASNLIFLFTVEFKDQQCGIIPGYQQAFMIFNMVDSVVTLLLPAILIVLMNAMITIKLRQFTRHYHLRNVRGTVTSSETSFSTSTLTSLKNTNKHSMNMIRSTRGRQPPNLLLHKSQRNVTKMLLTVSTVFIGLNLPSYALRLYDLWFFNQPELPCIFHQLQVYFMMLFYTNFGINFLLYSACGTSFRRTLFTLLRAVRCSPYKACKAAWKSNSNQPPPASC